LGVDVAVLRAPADEEDDWAALTAAATDAAELAAYAVSLAGGMTAGATWAPAAAGASRQIAQASTTVALRMWRLYVTAQPLAPVSRLALAP
jgi:hypothetical protein